MSDNKNDGFYHGYDDTDGSGNYYSDLPDYGSGQNYSGSQMNAVDRMDEMLNEYRQAHGMKGRSSYQRPQQTSYSSEQSRSYSYQRDARNQMDDMLNDYRREQEKRNAVSDNVIKGLTEPVGRRRRRWAESYSNTGMYTSSAGTRLSSGKRVVVCLFFAGALLILLGLLNGVRGYLNAQETERLIAGYTPVDGVVTYVYKSSGRRQTTKYEISYKYSYNDKEYKGNDRLYTSSAEKLDLKSKNSVGKNITVYIDPDNPSESMLDSDPYPAFWVWLMPFVGVVLIIVGIVKVKKT